MGTRRSDEKKQVLVDAIEKPWRRIEAWLTEHARSELLVAPPVSPVDLERLGSALGRALPPELTLWLSIHDGGDFVVWTEDDGWTFFSAAQIARSWRALQDLHAELAAEYGSDAFALRAIGPVSPVYWKPAWIPFATNGSGDLLCMDMEPEPGGTAGQVVAYWRDPSPREVIGPTLAALLSRYADGLERGEYEVEPFVGVVPRESPSE